MIKALLILVVWTKQGYVIEDYPVQFETYKQCLVAKHEIQFRHAHRLAVVAQDIICTGA